MSALGPFCISSLQALSLCSFGFRTELKRPIRFSFASCFYNPVPAFLFRLQTAGEENTGSGNEASLQGRLHHQNDRDGSREAMPSSTRRHADLRQPPTWPLLWSLRHPWCLESSSHHKPRAKGQPGLGVRSVAPSLVSDQPPSPQGVLISSPLYHRLTSDRTASCHSDRLPYQFLSRGIFCPPLLFSILLFFFSTSGGGGKKKLGKNAWHLYWK